MPAVVTRPNGKQYRARKPPVALVFENDRDHEINIMVMRSHDVEAVRDLATGEAGRHGYTIDETVAPILTWSRETIRDHEPWLEYDEVRGMPCVVFECGDL